MNERLRSLASLPGGMSVIERADGSVRIRTTQPPRMAEGRDMVEALMDYYSHEESR